VSALRCIHLPPLFISCTRFSFYTPKHISSFHSEWYTFSDWLKVDMRQILVETHNGPMPNGRDFFFNLHDAGFVIFSKEANYENAGKSAFVLFYLCICDI